MLLAAAGPLSLLEEPERLRAPGPTMTIIPFPPRPGAVPRALPPPVFRRRGVIASLLIALADWLSRPRLDAVPDHLRDDVGLPPADDPPWPGLPPVRLDPTVTHLWRRW